MNKLLNRKLLKKTKKEPDTEWTCIMKTIMIKQKQLTVSSIYRDSCSKKVSFRDILESNQYKFGFLKYKLWQG